MIDQLKPYPTYKDSGVEWLGQVPAHWEVRRLKNVCLLVYGDALASEVRRDGNVPVHGSNGRVGFHSVSNTLGPCLVIGRKGSFGKVNFSSEPVFAIDTTYYVDSRTSSADIRWLFYLFGWLQLDEVSKDSAIPGLDREDVYQRCVPVPPLPEQTAIVRFLDWAEGRIQRVIRAGQRRIKLLEEYKQALIHQAVTGQTDVRTGKRYLAYKDSGVEWLGEVPAHWEVQRLKRTARLNPSKSEVPLAMRNDPAVFLPMERVGSDGRFDASEVRPISDLWNGFTYFRRGDVIVAKITPCFENGKGACLQKLPTSVGFGSTEFHVIRPSAAVAPSYLYRVTTLSEFRRLGADEMTGAAGQQRVPAEFIANFLILLPPLSEQTVIVEYLDAQTAKIDAAMAADRRVIDLLREYRTRLISDVVTGKVDVREVAERLLEEPPEEESAEQKPMDETEVSDEGNGEESVELYVVS